MTQSSMLRWTDPYTKFWILATQRSLSLVSSWDILTLEDLYCLRLILNEDLVVLNAGRIPKRVSWNNLIIIQDLIRMLNTVCILIGFSYIPIIFVAFWDWHSALESSQWGLTRSTQCCHVVCLAPTEHTLCVLINPYPRTSQPAACSGTMQGDSEAGNNLSEKMWIQFHHRVKNDSIIFAWTHWIPRNSCRALWNEDKGMRKVVVGLLVSAEKVH